MYHAQYLHKSKLQIIAVAANVTISYQVNPTKRRYRPEKPLEKKISLCPVPKGSTAIGFRVNVEF